jgi:hypothetical protein
LLLLTRPSSSSSNRSTKPEKIFSNKIQSIN